MKKALFLLFYCWVLFTQGVQARTMTVVTYNLRYDNKNDRDNGNGWDKRLPVISKFITASSPDLLCTQEGLFTQLEDLKRMNQDYDYVGVGRDDGVQAGEHSAIFYKTHKYELLAHGDFWLAPITSSPNKGWDAALPRICTWAQLREKHTGFILYCFNLHMDHLGTVARRESSRLVLDTIRKMVGTRPVILMGDFNAAQNDTCYKTLQGSGLLADAYTFTDKHSGPAFTFNNFDTARQSNSRIDHVFLSGSFTVVYYEIGLLTYSDTVGKKEGSKQIKRYASDHHPVVVVARYAVP